MYWYNCPLYLKLRNDVYNEPQVVEWIKAHQDLFDYLQKQTGTNITTPEDVFYLDNLFQTLVCKEASVKLYGFKLSDDELSQHFFVFIEQRWCKPSSLGKQSHARNQRSYQARVCG